VGSSFSRSGIKVGRWDQTLGHLTDEVVSDEWGSNRTDGIRIWCARTV